MLKGKSHFSPVNKPENSLQSANLEMFRRDNPDPYLIYYILKEIVEERRNRERGKEKGERGDGRDMKFVFVSP